MFGYEHPSVATSLMNIGNVYCEQCKYEIALVEYHKSLDIKIQIYGQDHPDVVMAHNNIAVVYRKLHKYEEALLQSRES